MPSMSKNAMSTNYGLSAHRDRQRQTEQERGHHTPTTMTTVAMAARILLLCGVVLACAILMHNDKIMLEKYSSGIYITLPLT